LSNYKIRAHHAMCLQSFCGKGYNKRFVENMTHISSELLKNPMITVINYEDDICSECPNCTNSESCRYHEKVSLYDSKVFEYCSIKSGSTMYWNDFQDAVYKNIISVHKRSIICADCKWNEICQTIFMEEVLNLN
jgi:hypothetical protein